MKNLLSSSSYKIIPKNPLNSISQLVSKNTKASCIPISIQRKLIRQATQTPKIYAQPKIHKPDIPLYPIVSDIGAPTHALSRYPASKIQQFVGSTPSFIKDFTDFNEKTKSIMIDDSDLLVSFDIVSLFTKIPIPQALLLIS